MSHFSGPSGAAHDPLQRVHEAVEDAGCAPAGPIYKFTARCPAHEDRSPSLSVAEGADGRALLHCHAGCETAAIVAALGLSWSDLFPDGHRHAGRRKVIPPKPVDTADPIVEVLAALSVVGIGYRNTRDHRMFVADRCPGCDERRPGALWVTGIEGTALLCCFNGCEFRTILAMLEHELTSPRSNAESEDSALAKEAA